MLTSKENLESLIRDSEDTSNKGGLSEQKLPFIGLKQKSDLSESNDQAFHNNSKYPADLVDPSGPAKDDKWIALDAFPNPALFAAFFNKKIREKKIKFYQWQLDILKKLGLQNPTQQEPFKLCLRACNGSGKDYIVISSFVVWFAACKIRSLCIITSSSGVQLSAQTENYIRTMCQAVNEELGVEFFRIRQRFIRCTWSGSEIRLFATDEEGKAEGYHPLEPEAPMAIVVNEWKSVDAKITQALKRCTGFTHWLGVSTPGEPIGSFYHASMNWKNSYVIDYTQCPHISRRELEEDRVEFGEDSPWFRSKYLALFTTIGGAVILPADLINRLAKLDIEHSYDHWPIRVGIDIGASYNYDPTVMMFVKGNHVVKMVKFYEEDTTRTTTRIEQELDLMQVSRTHKYIYIDDGGVGRGVSFNLTDKGWEVNRILSQRQAISKKEFGNRGAENWFRCKRIFEEELFDVKSLSETCRRELYTRRYKNLLVGARIFLESKKDARAEGRPSPNEADALILALTGLTINDYLHEGKPKVSDNRPKIQLHSQQAIYDHYEDNETYGPNRHKPVVRIGGNRIFNSLRKALIR